MKIKYILQLSILLSGLLLVIMFRNFSESGGFTSILNAFFSTSKTPKINWCADHVVDVAWTNDSIPENLKKLDMASLRNNYCELTTEAIQGVDLSQVEWVPLAESSGATGIKTVLEWNKEHSLFKSAGMPFKSSNFSRVLVDK